MAVDIRDVSASEFAERVVARSHQVPVVVDFWAEWCGPCRVLGPILERAATEAGGSWELVKVDVDQNQALAGEHGVQGIPTVVGFRDGGPVARFTGALPEAQVRSWIRELVPTRADRLAADASAAVERGDLEVAEEWYREALVADPGHVDAGVGLAGLLLDRGEAGAAAEILGGLADSEPVRALRSRARVSGWSADTERLEAAVAGAPDDWSARLHLGRALAADGSYAEALDHLLEVVKGSPELRDEARRTTLDLFEVLGDGRLVADYRRRLASALF